MSVEEIRRELRQLRCPDISLQPTEEELQKFNAYMSRREELADLLAAAEREEQQAREESGLRERVKALVDSKKSNIAKIAVETGYSRPTISMYLAGTYKGNVAEVEKKIEDYLQAQGWGRTGEQRGQVLAMPTRPVFFESQDARKILGVCRSCQEYSDMGIVIGKSGYGKTHTLRNYAKLPKVVYIECNVMMSPKDVLRKIEKGLGIPKQYGTADERLDVIADFCRTNGGYLLIVDEADKLMDKYTTRKADMLRALHDKVAGNGLGLVLAGEPKLAALIQTYMGLVENRMTFQARLAGLRPEEVEEYLGRYHIDKAAMEELKNRAGGLGKGCFRLLDRTMKNVQRLMETPDQEITLKLIEQASGMMML